MKATAMRVELEMNPRGGEVAAYVNGERLILLRVAATADLAHPVAGLVFGLEALVQAIRAVAPSFGVELLSPAEMSQESAEQVRAVGDAAAATAKGGLH